MKQILIATTNPAKITELRKGLQVLEEKGFKVLTLEDVKITDEPEETGETFQDNAKLKATYYGDLTDIPTIADDGGFMIEALNGEPGVKSRRWLGYKASDEELIAYTLKKMHGVPKEKRGAKLRLCLCYYNPVLKQYFFVEEDIDGYVAEKPALHYLQGFPYRALHIVTPYNKYYDELSVEEHAKINHRLKAIKKLVSQII